MHSENNMLGSPTKRTITDSAFASNAAVEVPRSDDLSSELLASIRSAALRARKNVLEGYRNNPSSLPSSPSQQSAPFLQTASATAFSAGDMLPIYTPKSSPTKRRRPSAYDEESSDCGGESDSDMRMEIQEDGNSAVSSTGLNHGARPMRPLRRTAKQ